MVVGVEVVGWMVVHGGLEERGKVSKRECRVVDVLWSGRVYQSSLRSSYSSVKRE